VIIPLREENEHKKEKHMTCFIKVVAASIGMICF